MKKWLYARTLVAIPLLLLCIVSVGAEKAELKRHTVMVDGHSIALWEKSAANAGQPVLLVHGRTWSALPDFDLQVEGEDLSLMDALVDAGYAVYAIDLRGYGETPRDESGWLTPNRAADDTAAVVAWINTAADWDTKTHLFGWSRGSTISQLAVQRNPGLVESLTLFGYWRDDAVDLPMDEIGIKPLVSENTAEAAASDFITPGSISQKAIDTYVEVSLAADPVMVDLRNDAQYNELNGAEIGVPTLIIYGEFDPIGPPEIQAKLYTSIGSPHKLLVSVPGGDHAAFMEAPREFFVHTLVSFIEGANR
jgi:pimeloyl-ACP methyl ester carboxylesterase